MAKGVRVPERAFGIAMWVVAKEHLLKQGLDLLKQGLDLPNGMPSRDVFDESYRRSRWKRFDRVS